MRYVFHSPGLDHVPAGYFCYDYPVREDPHAPFVAIARVWPRKHIAVGPSWFLLTGGQQWAVCLHEAAHLRNNDFLRRLLWLPLCFTALARRMTHEQEFKADEFAIEKGYGVELMQFLMRCRVVQDRPGSQFHPDLDARIEHIRSKLPRSDYVQVAA